MAVIISKQIRVPIWDGNIGGSATGAPVSSVSALLTGNGPVPDSINFVNYIQSSGTQWIDSGFKPNQDTELVIDCDFLETNTGSDHHIASVNDSARYYALRAKADRTGYQIRYNAGGLQAVAAGSLYGRHTFRRNKNKTSIDGGAETVSTYGTFQISNTLPISCYKGPAGQISGMSSLKIYSFLIYDNGTLVRSFWPCLDPNGVACLYDKVSEEYFYNAGSGEFTAG